MIQAQFTLYRLGMLCFSAIVLLWVGACAPTQDRGAGRSPHAPTVQPHPYSQAPGTPSRMPIGEAQVAPGDYQEIRIGLLLPLTGNSAALGQAMLDAAMLGLFDKYAALPKGDRSPRITLLPKDTAGKPVKAAKAAKEAMDEGAALILGPLFSNSVKAVTPVAAKRGINVISFSNNAEVAGDNSFLFGFMPKEQVTRVVEQAHKAGHKKIAALLPANRYGALMEEALLEHAALSGMDLAGVVQYPPEAQDIAPYAQRLVGMTTNGKPIEMDALLLGEGGTKLEALAARLQQFRMGNREVKYLGTGLWDNPALRGNPALMGSWFASSPLASYHSFIARFEATHDYTPPRLASLGYDAVALAATLAAQGGFNRDLITAASGYEGPANGIFRFRPDGTISRGLSVLTFKGDDISEVSPAPRMFY